MDDGGWVADNACGRTEDGRVRTRPAGPRDMRKAHTSDYSDDSSGSPGSVHHRVLVHRLQGWQGHRYAAIPSWARSSQASRQRTIWTPVPMMVTSLPLRRTAINQLEVWQKDTFDLNGNDLLVKDSLFLSSKGSSVRFE